MSCPPKLNTYLYAPVDQLEGKNVKPLSAMLTSELNETTSTSATGKKQRIVNSSMMTASTTCPRVTLVLSALLDFSSMLCLPP